MKGKTVCNTFSWLNYEKMSDIRLSKRSKEERKNENLECLPEEIADKKKSSEDATKSAFKYQ